MDKKLDGTHALTSDRRTNRAVEEAVREGREAAGLGDYVETLNTLSRRGVPKAVIERIFVYRQCCRSTDKAAGKQTR